MPIHTDGQLYHVCRERSSDSGWNMYGIGAGMSGIANANAGMFWSVGSDGALWRNDGGRWTQVVQTMPTGTAVDGPALGNARAQTQAIPLPPVTQALSPNTNADVVSQSFSVPYQVIGKDTCSKPVGCTSPIGRRVSCRWP